MFKSCLSYVALIYVTCYRTVFDNSFQKLNIDFDENIFDLEFLRTYTKNFENYHYTHLLEFNATLNHLMIYKRIVTLVEKYPPLWNTAQINLEVHIRCKYFLWFFEMSFDMEDVSSRYCWGLLWYYFQNHWQGTIFKNHTPRQ